MEKEKQENEKKSTKIFPLVVGITAVFLGVIIFFIIKSNRVTAINIVSAKFESENVKNVYSEAERKFLLKTEVTPDTAKYVDVTWTSSDESVATVVDGSVTTVGEGKCTITAKTKNGKSDSAEVFVSKVFADWSYDGILNGGVYDSIAHGGTYEIQSTFGKSRIEKIGGKAVITIEGIASEKPYIIEGEPVHVETKDGYEIYNVGDCKLTIRGGTLMVVLSENTQVVFRK